MVWIHDSGVTANNVIITDEPPIDTTYAGNLTCTPAGASVVHSCSYDPNLGPRGTVTVIADIAPDPGQSTQDGAANEVVVSFDVTIDNPDIEQTIENQAQLSWDADNDGTPDFVVLSDDPTTTDDTDPSVVSVEALAQTGQEITIPIIVGVLVLSASASVAVKSRS